MVYATLADLRCARQRRIPSDAFRRRRSTSPTHVFVLIFLLSAVIIWQWAHWVEEVFEVYCTPLYVIRIRIYYCNVVQCARENYYVRRTLDGRPRGVCECIIILVLANPRTARRRDDLLRWAYEMILLWRIVRTEGEAGAALQPTATWRQKNLYFLTNVLREYRLKRDETVIGCVFHGCAGRKRNRRLARPTEMPFSKGEV